MHAKDPTGPLPHHVEVDMDWQALLDDLPVGAFLAREGGFVYVNKALAQQFGYEPAELLSGVSSLELAVPEDRETVRVHARRRKPMVPELPYEIECLRKDGRRFDARVCGLRVHTATGEADLVTIIDISESRRTIRAAMAEAERMGDLARRLGMNQTMLDALPKAVVAIDHSGQIRYANAATSKLLGYAPDQLQSMQVYAMAPHRQGENWLEHLHDLKQTGPRNLTGDWLTASGRTIQVALTASHMEHEGKSFVFLCQDEVSSAMPSHGTLLHTANYCDVTGLPNQQMLRERLRSEALLAVMDQRNMAVLVFGINELPHISEQMGYAFGDKVLLKLSKHLAGIPKGNDILAHLGGGEFVLVFCHTPEVNDDATLNLCRSIQDVITAPLQVDKQFLQLSCNIGAVIYPRDTNETEHVLRQAQAAMRMAVSLGPNRVYGYTPQANAHISARLAREAAFRGALARGELRLEYQPQVDLHTGRILGVEALLRWCHPELGEIKPDAFIPIAEETGLIIPVGNWVLQTACDAATRWQNEGLPALRMSVNISPRQLQQPDIADTVERALKQSGLAPHHLTLELTERMLHDQPDALLDTLKQLKALGVSIAMDDFGTGYSSLRSLRRLPIDMIKIDRTLVPDVIAETQDVSLTRAIITMAHGLQKKVLAVGVENSGELALLCANQCDEMQGFYFSPALPEADLLAMLREGRCIAQHLLGRQKRQRTLLIVDDDANIVAALKRLLRKDGYHIVTADSGPAGLQKLAENEVDVIISDQRMPGMTGVEFLRRTKELYPETIRMVLSGFTELRSATDAINEGAIYKFLTKPWDDALLRANIEEAFHQKEMGDDNRRLDREVQDANRELAEVNGRLQHLLTSQREHLHREEANLLVAREMLDNIPAPVFGMDEHGIVTFVNPDAENLFEGAAKLIGQHIDEAPHRELGDIWRARDGRYRDVTLGGMRLRAVCRPLHGSKRARGSLMVLVPGLPQPSTRPADLERMTP